MTFTDNEILNLKQFCQEIINRPRPLDAQPNKKEGVYLWCEDWEMIEIMKYLFLGKSVYYGDTPPNRLKNNPLWSKDEIARKAENLKENCQDAKHIIAVLREKRDNAASGIS